MIREQIYRVVFYQLIAAVVAVLVWYLVSGTVAAGSALSGGFIGVLASFFFARMVVRSRKSDEPRSILFQLYLGEGLKIVITVVLFAIVFILLRVEILPLLTSYIATLFVFWPSLLLVMPQNKLRD